nr:immunoglobulin heavy chain junction region [Macaca mulatta]MOW86749.1 immunoglobulin heavy chain junction region [Macaca mulatta]MOW87090.1 immunoglobulin heavy chain junction region [Macaca mulatta]MOW87175.1 immunoglobulin heavy chain junction region [Macaca mulatta]MOW87330.1 immunoglobulin heavy chain junction region [Macaca mulatta]
CARQDSNYDYW